MRYDDVVLAVRLAEVDERLAALERINQPWEEGLDRLERMVATSLSDMENRVEVLLTGLRAAEAEGARERVEAIRQSVQAVEEVRKAITAVLVEEKRLVGSARSSEQALKQAIDSIGTWLEKAVDVALRGVLTKQEQGLQDFQRLVGRLSVSGGSPFQTAKAQVLQHLLSKENIGGKHTSRERALESLDQRLRRYGDQALDDLIRMGLVAQKPAAYGMQVAVVAQRVRDAEHFIEGGELQQGS